MAIRMLVNGHPEIHRNGFKQAVRDLWMDLVPDTEPDELPKLRFLPDAYRLDRENQQLLIYEVEDTHPVPAEKLQALANMWFRWDAEDEHEWLPRLFIVDRYGSQVLEVDLMAAWYASLPATPKEHGGLNG